MWLINTSTLQLQHFVICPSDQYAILSHRWETDELDFGLFHTGQGRELAGFKKVELCCKQACEDGLQLAWIDTCCIDKTSSAELSESINSMYQWYKKANKCYVYLSDVQGNGARDISSLLLESLWFTRGWTLQELLAPRSVQFFDNSWRRLGTRDEFAESIHLHTTIPIGLLRKDQYGDVAEGRLTTYSIAERMTWASERHTKRAEDIAYCLMGLFQVNMPLLYGEGEAAFQRLQEAIIEKYDDESIFTWINVPRRGASLLAPHPRHFAKSQVLNNRTFAPTNSLPKPIYALTHRGIRFERPLIPFRLGICIMALYCMRTHDPSIRFKKKADNGSDLHEWRDPFSSRAEYTQVGIYLYKIGIDQYCRIPFMDSDLVALSGVAFGAGRYALPIPLERMGHPSSQGILHPRTIFIRDPTRPCAGVNNLRVLLEFKWSAPIASKRISLGPSGKPPTCELTLQTPEQAERMRYRTYPFPEEQISHAHLDEYVQTPVSLICDEINKLEFDSLEKMREGIGFTFHNTQYIRQLRVGFDQDFKPTCRLMLSNAHEVDSWRQTSMWEAAPDKIDDTWNLTSDFKPELIKSRVEDGFWIAKGTHLRLFNAVHTIHEKWSSQPRAEIRVHFSTDGSATATPIVFYFKVTETVLTS